MNPLVEPTTTGNLTGATAKVYNFGERVFGHFCNHPDSGKTFLINWNGDAVNNTWIPVMPGIEKISPMLVNRVAVLCSVDATLGTDYSISGEPWEAVGAS